MARKRKSRGTPKCTPARHRALVKQRARNAKYRKNNPGAGAKASAAYYRRNRAKISARRKQLRSKAHRAEVARLRAKYGGDSGRPRTC